MGERRAGLGVCYGACRVCVLLVAVVLAPGCGPGGGDAPPEAPSEPTEPVRPDDVLDAAWSPRGLRLAVTWNRGTGARLYGLLAGTDSTPAEAGRGRPLSRGRGAWATWSPDGLWIAYESGGDLHRMRPDGTGDEALTRDPAPESHPAYAPDGGRLAFVAARDGGGGASLWLMDADGGNHQPIPVPVRGAWRAPTWDPDGTAIVAEAETGEGPTLYRVGPESGSAERIVSGSDPAFAPGGDALYFARSDSVFRRSWPASDGEGEALVVTPGHTPRPAPDGLRLAFVRGNPPAGALYVVHLETGEVRRLTAEAPPRPARRPGEGTRSRRPEGGGDA